MKITMKAILCDINPEHKTEVDKLMTVFSSAVRYAFNRIMEGNKILAIEKSTAHKYGLNIRQAKDAVENARQTLISQKKLLKLNCENYCKRVNALETILKEKSDKLSATKKKSLMSKLEKRNRKRDKLKAYMDNNTIPPVTFGTKAMFIKRCKGMITHEEWVDIRSNRVYSRGDKTKCGNPNLRIVLKNNMSYLEISTLDKTDKNRAIKIQTPVYLPQKRSKKTGKINGINYREMFMAHLSTQEAYQVELIRKKSKYYCHITFEVEKSTLIYTGHRAILGIDTNPDGYALTLIDNEGNYRSKAYLKQHELVYARGNRRTNLCGELAREAVKLAKENVCGVAIEDLRFKDDRDMSHKYARIRHQFIYSKLLVMLESACMREGIEVVKVKPQYTSKIGLYKYCHQFGMDIHNGAAMVIARRSYGFGEKLPKMLKNKFQTELSELNSKNEWAKWSLLNKIIKRKAGEKPGDWIENRSSMLGLG